GRAPLGAGGAAARRADVRARPDGLAPRPRAAARACRSRRHGGARLAPPPGDRGDLRPRVSAARRDEDRRGGSRRRARRRRVAARAARPARRQARRGAGPRAGRRRRGARLVAGAAPSVRAVPGARDVSPGAAAFGYTLRAVGARLALALPLVMLATALAVRAHPASRVEGFDTAGWWLHL